MTTRAEAQTARSDDDVFAGGGDMGALMRAFDWESTPLGPVAGWPQSLRTALSICLASRFPMLIWWGPDLAMLYNDAYRPMLGATKHPRAMGLPGKECWPEIWDVIGPMLDGVFTRGEATWSDDQLLLLDRNGYVEECYFTFSYSPIRDESGGIGGVFTAVTETTKRVIGERRLGLLEELATRTGEARTVDDVYGLAMTTLADAQPDIPFALLYLLEDDGKMARLVASTVVPSGTPGSPQVVNLRDEASTSWPLASVVETGRPAVAEIAEGSTSPAGTPRAIVLPVPQPGQDLPAALLVTGLSPRLPFDDAYLGFLSLVAGHIASAMNDARAHEDERRRAEALAELDRAKTTFFSNVSHELRTPLTLLLGPLDDILDNSGLSTDQRERLELVRRNGLRLLKLVNTLLDFSRIQSDRMEAAYEPLDLGTYTAELASLFRSAIERAGLRFLVDCPPLPEPVYVDRQMWEKVVFNLLSNALKFTLSGEIAVAVRPTDASVEVEVRDTGAGIPEHELPYLFTRFHRVRGTEARTYEGTGIGLALTHDLVRLHGGTIRVSSAVGEGTSFTLVLPLGRDHLAVPPPAGGLQASPADAAPYLAEAEQWILPEDQPQPSARPWPSTDESHAPAQVSRARIVLADDNADMRDYLCRLLEPQYEVEAVPDGLAALIATQSQPPDLVLADIMMPRMDGLELLRALRADPATISIPVVLLSARAGEEASVEGLQAGADDYLIKPFSARELLARVKVHVDMARTRAQLEEEKEQFVSHAAHDLKNPLAAIKGFAQVMQRQLNRTGTLDPDRAAFALRNIERTATRLNALIAELQDVVMIHAGHPLTLQQAPLDLAHLVREAVEQHRQADTAHQVDLVLPSEPLTLVGDAPRLERVLLNLLSNATKYSPVETTIRVTVGTESEGGRLSALLTVADQGIGIPSSDLAHIFDRFSRGSNVAPDVPGSGIGLASVRQIVEQHQGTVTVESTEGVGSIFRLHLPLDLPPSNS